MFEFYSELENLGDRLGKDGDQIRRAFVKGFKSDYPSLWTKMRTDYKSYTTSRLLNAAKEFIELTRSESEKNPRRGRVLAAVAPGGPVELTTAAVAPSPPSIGRSSRLTCP